MAYYDQAPKKRKPKTNYAEQGSWEDEGSHYRQGKSSRSARSGYNGASEHNPNHRSSTSGYTRRESGWQDRSGRAEARGYRSDRKPNEHSWYQTADREARGERRQGRSPVRRYSEKEAPARTDYHDYEYRAPAPLSQETEALERENLLVGRNPIREAIKSGRDIEKLLVQRGELSGSAREIVMMAKEAHIVVQ